MEISILIDNAKKKAAETPSPSAETFLNKIRKNLINLMCQADLIEATGSADAFGGAQQVGEDISKAVVNLVSLGIFLGVDVNKALSFEEKEKTSVVKKEESAPVKEALQPADNGDNGDKPLFKTEESLLDGQQQPPEDEIITLYKDRFKNAQDEAEVKKIWGDITNDKKLQGKEKFELQTDKSAALLRIKSNIYTEEGNN